MRRLLFLIGLLGVGATSAAWAQSPADSATVKPLAATPWFHPRHVVVQVAGGMGMISGGPGYSYWRERGEAELLVGYVPKRYAGSALTSITVRTTYSPWLLQRSPRWQFRPLTFGTYFTYTSGVINPGQKGQYYEGYYWFSRRWRVGPVLGGRVTYVRPSSSQRLERPRHVSLYYELATNDLYITSFATNLQGGLSMARLLTLGLGVKASF